MAANDLFSVMGKAVSGLLGKPTDAPKTEAPRLVSSEGKPEAKPASGKVEIDNFFAINNLIAPDDPSKKVTIKELK